MAFAHLHLHSEYSLLDGACRIRDIVERAKALGQTAVAITDHGVMYGVVDFYKAAAGAGIHPIIGCEVYVSPRARTDKVHGVDSDNSHLVLLCENEKGYQNLLKLSSLAFTEGFYSRPRVDHALLEQYHEGLIALSACLAGEIPKALTAGQYETAKKTALYYANLFGKDRFYLELQDHGIAEQKAVNAGLRRLSQETGIGLVATNDVHYLTRDDAAVQKVLLCIQTGTTLADPTPMAFPTDEFYMKSEEEMAALFPSDPEAIANTANIAARCQVELEFGKLKLPAFDAPNGDSNAYLAQLCREGAERRYTTVTPEITARLEYELSVIRKMGYADYFLIVADYVNYAKTHDIPVGPGRGSGAGSLCAYCVGITAIDPLKYNLLFERFLNPERVSMPDFDVDFCTEKREQVIQYVTQKYGVDRVAQIITFGTMAAKAALRDVARVMAVPYAVADRVAKLIPAGLGVTLDSALADSEKFRAAVDEDAQVRRIVDMAKRVEGMPRNASTHAAGVVIAPRPVSDYVPLCVNKDAIATQYPMHNLEELGVLKMDFLGLRNLTVIDAAEKMIQKDNSAFRMADIPLDDERVYAMLSKGNSDGVFQMESGGLKRVLQNLRPHCFEDLIAVISLYRPGPMDSIPKYIYNRRNPDKIHYAHPLLKPILEVTYGCIVYQEQVMEIFRTLAGYSFGRADVVRRAMAKKKHDVMQKEREIFINGLMDADGNVTVDGCVRRGVPQATAEKVFEEMASFASYAFNKSHAAAYALVAYQTAYLKAVYGKAYMAALLTSVQGSDKEIAYIRECQHMGIAVLPPHVNESGAAFTLAQDGIRFGLLAVRSVGTALADVIRAEVLRGGIFDSFFDFCERIIPQKECNTPALEALIACGALDHLGANRRQMLQTVPTLVAQIAQSGRRQVEGQLGFFDDGAADSGRVPLPPLEEFSFAERLKMEKETVGMYLSGHPLTPFAAVYKDKRITRIDRLLQGAADGTVDGKTVTVAGLISHLRLQTTRTGAQMAYCRVEDLYGALDVVIFPKALAQFGMLFEGEAPLQISGRVDVREDAPPQLLCERATPLTVPEKPSAPAGMYLRVDGKDTPQYRDVLALLSQHRGTQDVYIRFADSGKMVRAGGKNGVSADDTTVACFTALLGEDNVVYIPTS